jgi:hypothetical protein
VGPLMALESRNLLTALEAQLSKCPAAALCLVEAGAGAHPEWGRVYSSGTDAEAARHLLDSLCAAPLLDVLLALQQANRRLRREALRDSEKKDSHLGTARAVRDLALLLAPWLHHRTRRLQASRLEGDLLALPVRHNTLIEVAMAGLGDRGALFEPPLVEFGEPRAIPARSAPELGVDLNVDGHKFVREVALALARELACGPKVLEPLGDATAFDREALKLGTEREAFDKSPPGEALRALRKRIAYKARHAEQPFQLYLIVDRLQGQGSRGASVELLRACLPELEIVVPCGDLAEDETPHLSICDLLFHDDQAARKAP